MRRIFSMLLTLVLMAALAMPAAAETATGTSIRLEESAGTVEITNNTGKAQSVKNDMRLYNGYTVMTGAGDSSAYISLDGTKAVRLDSSSKIEVKKSGKQLELYVHYGMLVFNVTQPLAANETLNIRTGTMMTGVRGSSGWVMPGQVGLVHGHVEVTCFNPATGASATTPITSGQSMSYTPSASDGAGAPAAAPQQMTEEQIPAAMAEEIASSPELQEQIKHDVPALNVDSVVESAPEKRAAENEAAAAEAAAQETQAAQQTQSIAADTSTPGTLPGGAASPAASSSTSSGGGGSGGGGSSSSSSRSYTITLKTELVHVSLAGVTLGSGTAATVSENGTFRLTAGQRFTLHLTPKEGYEITSCKAEGAECAQTEEENGFALTFSGIRADTEITVTAAAEEKPEDPKPDTVTVSLGLEYCTVSGEGVAVAEDKKSAVVTLAENAESFSFTVTPDTGYEILEWATSADNLKAEPSNGVGTLSVTITLDEKASSYGFSAYAYHRMTAADVTSSTTNLNSCLDTYHNLAVYFGESSSASVESELRSVKSLNDVAVVSDGGNGGNTVLRLDGVNINGGQRLWIDGSGTVTVGAGSDRQKTGGETGASEQSAALNNNNTLWIGKSVVFLNYGTVTVNGGAKLMIGGSFENHGTLMNNGTVTILESGSFYNAPGKTVTNNDSATFTSDGTFINEFGIFPDNDVPQGDISFKLTCNPGSGAALCFDTIETAGDAYIYSGVASLSEGESVLIQLPVAEKTGFAFAGWMEDGKEIEYEEQKGYAYRWDGTTKNVTLTAQWKTVYEITLEAVAQNCTINGVTSQTYQVAEGDVLRFTVAPFATDPVCKIQEWSSTAPKATVAVGTVTDGRPSIDYSLSGFAESGTVNFSVKAYDLNDLKQLIFSDTQNYNNAIVCLDSNDTLTLNGVTVGENQTLRVEGTGTVKIDGTADSSFTNNGTVILGPSVTLDAPGFTKDENGYLIPALQMKLDGYNIKLFYGNLGSGAYKLRLTPETGDPVILNSSCSAVDLKTTGISLIRTDSVLRNLNAGTYFVGLVDSVTNSLIATSAQKFVKNTDVPGYVEPTVLYYDGNNKELTANGATLPSNLEYWLFINGNENQLTFNNNKQAMCVLDLQNLNAIDFYAIAGFTLDQSDSSVTWTASGRTYNKDTSATEWNYPRKP